MSETDQARESQEDAGQGHASATEDLISAFDFLTTCFDADGIFDTSKLLLRDTESKFRLEYDHLDEKNSQLFCQDAKETIAQNILYSRMTYEDLDWTPLTPNRLQNISKLALRGDLPAGISLSLLVHASKFSDKKRLESFCRLTDLLSSSNTELQVIPCPAPSLCAEARELLRKPPLSNVLLEHSSLAEKDLDEIRVEFVTCGNSTIRGWCAPSMVVVNVSALGNQMHLQHHIPLAVLLGHETRHVVVRKIFGNDLNFSTPTKPYLTDSCLGDGHRESGLWFETTRASEQ